MILNNILIKYAGFIWPGAPWGFCGCKSQDIWLHDVLYPLIIYTLINYKTSDWAQDQFRTREVGLQNSPFWRIQPKLGWWRCDCTTKQQLSMKSLIEGASCEACNDFSNIFDVLSQHLPLLQRQRDSFLWWQIFTIFAPKFSYVNKYLPFELLHSHFAIPWQLRRHSALCSVGGIFKFSSHST